MSHLKFDYPPSVIQLKTSQTNEEKLMEDLKKKGQAVTDLKNQFLIIQSELTKNIVSNQSVSREKLSLENRLRSLEEHSIIMNEVILVTPFVFAMSFELDFDVYRIGVCKRPR